MITNRTVPVSVISRKKYCYNTAQYSHRPNLKSLSAGHDNPSSLVSSTNTGLTRNWLKIGCMNQLARFGRCKFKLHSLRRIMEYIYPKPGVYVFHDRPNECNLNLYRTKLVTL